MCAGDVDLKDQIISPLYGSFENFPSTHLLVATNDILYPDQKKVIEKMVAQRIQLEIIQGKDMPHIWPLLPILYEAKVATLKIEESINSIVNQP